MIEKGKGKLPRLGSRVQMAQTTRVRSVEAGSWSGGGSAASRGYGARWREARLEFLKDNPLCVRCDAAGRVQPATVVDHRVPHRGDRKLFWDRGNWQSLCAPCHNGWKQREEIREFREKGI